MYYIRPVQITDIWKNKGYAYLLIKQTILVWLQEKCDIQKDFGIDEMVRKISDSKNSYRIKVVMAESTLPISLNNNF